MATLSSLATRQSSSPPSTSTSSSTSTSGRPDGARMALTFGSDAESLSEEEGEEAREKLTINKAFARRFEAKERRNDLFRAQAKGLLDGDSDSESEDEQAEALTRSMELGIMNTISMIRAKDTRIYDKAFHAFQDASEGEEEVVSRAGRPAGRSPKMTYKDMVREEALKKMEQEEEEEEEVKKESSSGIAYNAEQRQLKEAFKSAAGDMVSDSEEEGDVVKLKEKSEAEVEQEEDEFQQYVAGLQKDKKLSSQISRSLPALKEAFGKPESDKDEEFLRQYVLQRKWAREDLDSDEDGGAGQEGDQDLPESEEELEKAEEFEAKYNFRFEEEGADVLQSFPRKVEGSLRQTKDKRRKQRQAKKQREQEEKRRRLEELKRLKNLKKQELKARLLKAQQAAGPSSHSTVLAPEDLDKEFDPEQHDKLMQKMFNDEYYNKEDEDNFKPDISDLLDKDDFEDEESADSATKEGSSKSNQQHASGNDPGEAEGVSIPSKRGKEGKRPESATDGDYSIQGNPSVVNAEDSDLEEDNSISKLGKEALAELHALDYEGMAGGQKTRFRYKKVPATSYGLTTAEILSIPDNLLNEFVSRKRFVTYREEEWYVTNKQRRRFRRKVREAMDAHPYDLPPDTKTAANDSSSPSGEKALDEKDKEMSKEDKLEEKSQEAQSELKTRKRKRKRRKKADNVVSGDQQATPGSVGSSAKEAAVVTDNAVPVKKKRKRKRKRKVAQG